ncbi:hypothetical protein [Cellulomonas sp. Leaf334]|uniref:hypothetical protein n=1 Tax=Cellulomonas sp. Leaf334 TaxID=1736339 RepID=UPI0006F2932C|nr:hypothetical protein [Cellulomonas sp. Leaf334]KQR17464.1 hypothetical protein ASF78_09330 [Cellulomonas sp. Leaf334]
MQTSRSAVGAWVVVALLVGCGPVVAPDDRTALAGDGWHRVPDGPLSARRTATVAWVDDRFVVVGGDDGPPCPPNADCGVPTGEWRRDGATFDPTTGLWAQIADAPLEIPWATTAVVDGVLYLLVDRDSDGPSALLTYDVAVDHWATLPMPPDGPGRLVEHGDVLLNIPTSDESGATVDSWFDPATSTWHRLPDDPLGPSYDRSVVVVDGLVVLTAKDLVPSPGAERPSLVRAAELDPTLTTWTVLPGSEVIGSDPVAVAGRVVFPDVGGADGGEVGNWGRTYWSGRIFDPGTATWADLPEVPGRTSWPRVVVGDRVRVGDVLLDPVDGTTTAVPAPPWTDADSPVVAASPEVVFAWGGGSATGYLLTP